MPDQAQGLRALANRARRDRCRPPITATGEAATPHESSDTGPTSQISIAPIDSNSLVARTAGHAVVSGRLRSASNESGRKPAGTSAARVIAVTSGKGGVGKTNFSTNLSLALMTPQRRVIVVDADLGLANIHVVLGVVPRYNLEHVMRGEQTLRDTLCTGPNGLQLIGGASGMTDLANLDEARRTAFIEGLLELDSLADVIVIDTGAGLSRNVIAFLCAVEEIIVVTTPEPTAITDAYATIKVVVQENPQVRVMLVVNMAQTESEARAVADRLTSIARRFLNVEIDFLGYVPQDIAVTRCVRAQQPFVLAQPTCAAAQAVRQIARRLANQDTPADSITGTGFGGLLQRMQRFFGVRPDGPDTQLR